MGRNTIVAGGLLTADPSWYASDNGGLNLVLTTNAVFALKDTNGIFQSFANANYYLASYSPYRNAGTTNINSDVLAEIQTMTTYAPQDGGWADTNGTDIGYHYPINEDSDYDGIPDWWIWQNFGYYTFSATNMDSSGTNTMLYDYQHGTDPNVIAFTLSTPSLYVNQTAVPVQINLTGGIPGYYSVLVNDTNQADAVWLPYTGTNLLVTLGATDGVYAVSVWLKGYSPTATETWDTDEISFTLDRIAPQIILTSAVNATVIKPYLQLTGLANKPLLSLSYDITNAFGLVTNQDAFVTDQTFDTNRLDFSTNYFQAYDVPLATNANFITLRVTDRAGNTTTTNFAVTLDYTAATNPPTATLTWPQHGMAVSGTNITIRGTMSDETGTVLATVVNGDGTTNVITGIVERNGMFWLENVPLHGTNLVTIQATDAAGNVTITNIIIKPSRLTLTIDNTPIGDDLYKPTGTVYGTVSDPNATVTVNGINAIVDDTANWNGVYNWSADDVPNFGKGTAVFNAVANVAGAGQSANAMLAVERSHYVAVIYHKASEIITESNTISGYFSVETLGKGYGASAETNASDWLLTYSGGYGDSTTAFNPDNGYGYTSSQMYQWAGKIPGAESRSEIYTFSDSNGNSDNTINNNFEDQYHFIRSPTLLDLWQIGWAGEGGVANGYPPTWIAQYYADNIIHTWNDNTGNITTDKIPSAKTQVKLWTGGKSVVGRQSLFCIHASAESYGQAHDGGWIACPRNPVDPKKLNIAGKTPGADGKAWLALADNSEQDITLTAKGVKNYGAGPTTTDGVEKYKFQVRALTMGGSASHMVLNDDGSQPGYNCYVDSNGNIQNPQYPTLYESITWESHTDGNGNPYQTMTGNVNMQAYPYFKVYSTGGSDLVVRGKASGTGYPCTFWATIGTGADDSYWTIETTADNPITPSKVDYYNPLTIDWKIYSPDMKVHIEAGQTKCPVYVSLKPPITGDLFHSVVNLACSVPGATTDAGALANTWGFFSGKSVQTWDGKPLYYYLSGSDAANMTLPSLLNSHEGSCDAFASLLDASLKVNGIESTIKKVVDAGWLQNYSIAAKNIQFRYNQNNPSSYPYDIDTSPSGIPGQNTGTPAQKIFNYHMIVYLSLNGVYYDPSYGITAPNKSSYINAAFDGVDDGHNHWTTNTSGIDMW